MGSLRNEDWFRIYSDYVNNTKTTKQLLEQIPGASLNATSPHIYFQALPLNILRRTFPIFSDWVTECLECGGDTYFIPPTRNQIDTHLKGRILQETESKVGYLVEILKHDEMQWVGSSGSKPRIYCIECGMNYTGKELDTNHQEYLESALKTEEDLSFEEEVEDVYGSARFSDYIDLTISRKMYLLALLRVGADFDTQRINPICTLYEDVYHSTEETSQILITLTDNEIIAPVPDNELDAFLRNTKGGISYYLNRAYYRLTLNLDGKPISLQECQLYLEKDLQKPLSTFVNEFDSLLKAWEATVVAECIRYIDFKSDDKNIRLHEHKDNETTIKSLLDIFSIGQIFYIIDKASRDTADFYQSNRCSSYRHAVNFFGQRLKQFSEKCFNEGWDINHYHRDNNLQQSELSRVLFSLVLKLTPENEYTVIPYEHLGLHSNLSRNILKCPECKSRNTSFLQKKRSIALFCYDCDIERVYRDK